MLWRGWNFFLKKDRDVKTLNVCIMFLLLNNRSVLEYRNQLLYSTNSYKSLPSLISCISIINGMTHPGNSGEPKAGGENCRKMQGLEDNILV